MFNQKLSSMNIHEWPWHYFVFFFQLIFFLSKKSPLTLIHFSLSQYHIFFNLLGKVILSFYKNSWQFFFTHHVLLYLFTSNYHHHRTGLYLYIKKNVKFNFSFRVFHFFYFIFFLAFYLNWIFKHNFIKMWMFFVIFFFLMYFWYRQKTRRKLKKSVINCRVCMYVCVDTWK